MDTTPPIRRRFVRVGSRHVHYLRCGRGSPVVLVHPGIANGALFLGQIRRLSSRYNCFAFDNAGFGSSDALAHTDGSMADLADALAAAMRALDFPAVPLFGYHTGAAVALELAVRHPALVRGLILDGLPIFRDEDVQRLFAGDFAPPLVIDPLGGHFASTWTRFRDQAAFYPWHEKTPQTVLPVEVGATPQAIHTWVSYFYRSAQSYAGPFRAAHTFGAVAAERLSALTVPGRYFVATNDLLSKHFDRFPAMRPGHRNWLIGPSAREKDAALDACLAEFDAGTEAPRDPPPSTSSEAIARDYFDLDAAQVLVRSIGEAAAPPLLLLHDAPGSGLALEPLMRSLGRHWRVLAPDLPGCGESDPLAAAAAPSIPAPTLADHAHVLARLCRAFARGPVVVYGIGFGGSLAAELARAEPALVTRLVLRGLLLPSAEERGELLARYAPPIELDAAGTHWYRTWLMLRDSLIYWPWYNRTRAGLRRVPADFSGERLHQWTFEVMKQIGAYGQIIDAALRHDVEAALPGLEDRVLIVRDPLHPFSVWAEKAQRRFPAMPHLDADPDPASLASRLSALLASGTPPPRAPPR